MDLEIMICGGSARALQCRTGCGGVPVRACAHSCVGGVTDNSCTNSVTDNSCTTRHSPLACGTRARVLTCLGVNVSRCGYLCVVLTAGGFWLAV